MIKNTKAYAVAQARKEGSAAKMASKYISMTQDSMVSLNEVP